MSRNCPVVISAVLLSLSVEGQVFEAVYGFPNVSTSSGSIAPAPVPVVNGLTCGTFTAHGLSSNPNASGRFSYTGWPVGAPDGADNYATYTAALSPFSYYEFSLSPQNGFTLSLSQIAFSVRRSGTGVRNYCMRSSLDGFAANLAAGTGTSTNLQVIPDEVFFWKFDNTSTSSDQRGSEVMCGPQFSAITTPLYLRFYAWNSEAPGGSFSIDDVTIRGQMTDSAMLSGISDQSPEAFWIRAIPGFIISSCKVSELLLFSLEGKLLRSWTDPPLIISTGEIEAGFYVASVTIAREQIRRKMLLPQ
jgi:hypothetical protein